MSQVLHRRTQTDPASISSAPPSVPAAVRPSAPRPGWPNAAKALVAVLLVAVIVSTIAAIVNAGGSDRSEEEQLRTRIEEITADRNDALLEVVEIDGRLTSVREELAAAQAATEAEAARVDALEAELAAAIEARDTSLATVAAITAERDDAVARLDALTGQVDELSTDVADLRAQLAKAIAERDALKNVKPTTVDVSLVGVQMAGTYTVKVTDVAGVAPKFTKLTIATTKEGWLTMSIPGLGDGGLTMVDGALNLVTTSTSAVPACDGVARQAQVVMTVSPDGYQVTSAGAARTGLHGVLTLTAPATGSCPAVVVMANAQLTKTA